MPNAVIKSYAKKSGKSTEQVEKVWDEVKKSAHKAHPSWGEGNKLYAYVNGTVAKRLGLKESAKKVSTQQVEAYIDAHNLHGTKTEECLLDWARGYKPLGDVCMFYGHNLDTVMRHIMRIEQGQDTKKVDKIGAMKRRPEGHGEDVVGGCDEPYIKESSEDTSLPPGAKLLGAASKDGSKLRYALHKGVVSYSKDGSRQWIPTGYTPDRVGEHVKSRGMTWEPVLEESAKEPKHLKRASRPRSQSAKKCPECGEEVWDVAHADQTLNKCWKCGQRWMNDTEDIEESTMKSVPVPTQDQCVFDVTCEPEHTPVKGNALASGNDATDRKEEQRIMKALERGNDWAWCVAKVTCRAKRGLHGVVGVAYLGPCSYNSKEDFIQAGGYYEDMKAEAYEDFVRAVEGESEVTESGSLLGAESPTQCNSQGMFESLLDVVKTTKRHESTKKPATLVGRTDRYDFYKGADGGDVYWNIVPRGSQAPTGGYPDKAHIERVKGVKFSDAKPVNESTKGGEHADSVQQFRNLSPARRNSLAKDARLFISLNPGQADNNRFWKRLSARQVRELWYSLSGKGQVKESAEGDGLYGYVV